MVVLVVNNLDETSELQRALVDANIEFQLAIDMGHYGIQPPHIVVNGVPLDEDRSFKWIKEYENGC